MLVELIGCTSAGKTTLARGMLRAGIESSIPTVLGDDLILESMRLRWINNDFLRRRAIESVSLPACAFSWGEHRDLCRLAFRTAAAAPGSWLYRASVARIALNKIGIRAILRRWSSPERIVLLDNEGVLQAAHNLFVHAGDAGPAQSVSSFVEAAPLPDVAIYLRESEDVLVERTLRRGHRRLPPHAAAHARTFVRKAVEIFDRIADHAALTDRLVVVDRAAAEPIVSSPTGSRAVRRVVDLLSVCLAEPPAASAGLDAG